MPEEPKQLTNAKINVSGIGINSEPALLDSTENLSVAMTKINTYLSDLKSGAFTEAYSHPTYTSRQAGLYKITVDTTGHVFNAIEVLGSDLPPHTHDYIPLSGSDNITGNLKINSAGKGLFLKDKNSNLYPGIVDNGTNLWIGSGATSSTHHVGNTYISAGYNSTSGNGNSTIFISVPNATNDGGTNYNVLHDGNTSFTQTITSSDTGAYQIGTIKINGSDTILYGKDTDTNTDTKVNMIARGITKAYLLGTTTSPTSSNQAVTSVAETGVYFDTTAGELHATTFEGTLSGNIDHTNTDPTSAAGYGLTFHTNAGTTEAKALRTNGSVRVMLYNNETTGGYARLTLGNNTAATSGGKNGIIQLYGESASRFCTLTCTDSKSLIFDQDAQTAGTNFSPAVTDTYDLGTSSLKWRNIYANNVYSAFNGDLTGNVTGNINHTLTNPTTEIAYGLTFHDGEGSTGTKGLLTNDAVCIKLKNSSTGGYSVVMAGNDTTAASGGKFGVFRAFCSNTSYAQFSGGVSVDETGLIFKTSTAQNGDYLRPEVTETYDLGTSSKKWRNIYAKSFYGSYYGALTGNVNHTLTDPTTETQYGLTFHDDEGSTGTKGLLTNDAVAVSIAHSITGGSSIIIAGNETTAGSGGKSGGFRAYTTGTSYAQLRGDTSSNSTGLAFKTSTNNDGDYIAPYTTDKYDMGTSLYRWRNVYAITLNGALDPSNLSDAVSVSKGGTGQTTLTSNAIIAGNGASSVNMIATASGALYATSANGAAQFGTLPVAQGGTGATSASSARTNLGLGTAATKDSTTSVTSGSTGLVTSGAVYNAIELDTAVSLTSSVGTVSKQAYYSAATKICTFVLQLKLTSALSASSSTTTIATLGKHPTYVCPVVAIDGSNNGLVARIDNSGNIQLCKNAAISSGSTIRVSGSFPVA